MKMIQAPFAMRLKRQTWLLSTLAIFSFNALSEEATIEPALIEPVL